MPFREQHQPLQIPFKLEARFQPAGDQPGAIAQLTEGVCSGLKYQTLLGVTGSGKTFTMANVIAAVNRPALVIAPNKTLAAQLYSELLDFFPSNRVRYFVSYYDYYQPEAYVPSTDTFIEKDSAINEEIDKMRHAATKAILESSDCIVVASVSCIYGLGAPEEYFDNMLYIEVGERINRDELIGRLVAMQYKRSEIEFVRGTFRVRGEAIDIFPSDEDAVAVRLVLFGDEIEELRHIDGLTGDTIAKVKSVAIYPLSHFVTGKEALERAIVSIEAELQQQLATLRARGKLLEAERLEQRTLYDLELLREINFCPGIENYSRHLAGRDAGEAPTTLIDYFPKDFLVIIDESHVTVPQIGAMYRGDRSRKETLVEYGFRLPSALDNRPLTGDEFWERVGQTIFVSATPAERELTMSEGAVVEQVNRPTGLLDPVIEVRPGLNQVDDLLIEARKTITAGDRVIVTTLTKKMAEHLAEFCREAGVRSKYLHSDINAIERVEILRAFRKGEFDLLIGINLLREGLDIPETGLVAILDADKEGFLRSARSLIQTIGRAARNINGRVLLYADKITDSMRQAIDETERRRKIQAEFNQAHGVVPRSTRRADQVALGEQTEEIVNPNVQSDVPSVDLPVGDEQALERLIQETRAQMLAKARAKEFEEAAVLRDRLAALERKLLLS